MSRAAGPSTLTVIVQLFGPFETRSGIDCSGTPIGTVKVTAKGDGTYKTQPVTLGQGRLLHLPRVDSRHSREHGLHRQVRRDRRDDARLGEADGDDARLGGRRAPGLGAVRPHPGFGARRDRGCRAGRALRPVRDESRDPLHRQAVFADGRYRAGRRRLPLTAGTDRCRRASTPSTRHSSAVRTSRAPRRSAPTPQRRRSALPRSSPAGAIRRM